MGNEHYYHMFANGDDAKDFITSEEEHKAAFNRFAICQYRTGVSVLSMSVEDSHPHSLLWGDLETCMISQNLRTRYHLSYRQLSTLVKLPEVELRKYVK